AAPRRPHRGHVRRPRDRRVVAHRGHGGARARAGDGMSAAFARPSKTWWLVALLVAIASTTALLEPRFLTAENIENVVQRTALFGVIGIGAAFPIVTGGIDLSIGSVVALVATLLPVLLEAGVPAPLALVVVLAVAVSIGTLHGLLVTRLGLQPFVVTLCGL